MPLATWCHRVVSGLGYGQDQYQGPFWRQHCGQELLPGLGDEGRKTEMEVGHFSLSTSLAGTQLAPRGCERARKPAGICIVQNKQRSCVSSLLSGLHFQSPNVCGGFPTPSNPATAARCCDSVQCWHPLPGAGVRCPRVRAQPHNAALTPLQM